MSARPALRASGSSRLSTRYCLSADSIEAGALLEELAQIIVIERRHGRSPGNSRTTFGAICSSGSTAEHMPASATAPGMPQTTLVASSCAITLPPAATMSARAAHAVGAHAGQDQRQDPAAPDLGGGGEQRIDRRLAEIAPAARRRARSTGAVAAHHAHVPAAGREIDAAGMTGSPSMASCAGRRLARARCSARMVVKVGGMCWVISTGARRSRRRAGHQRRSAPAGRRSRRRSAARAARRAERPQLERPQLGGRGASSARCARPHEPARAGAAGAAQAAGDADAGGARAPSARIFSISSCRKVSAVVTSRVALRLRNVVGGAERQRLELTSALRRVSVEAMMTTRSRFFASSCGSAEMPSSSGISMSSTATSGSMRSIWSTASQPGAQRGRRPHARLGIDPARDQAADRRPSRRPP